MTDIPDALSVAIAEILAYMVEQSGVRFEPGVGTDLYPLAEGVFEVRVGGTTIGTLHSDAVLEVAERIRLRRN